MKPYYDHAGITIYCGDALAVLPLLPGDIGALITDPPYCSGGRQQAQARGTITKSRRLDTAWFTDNMGTDTYVRWMREIAGATYALASPGAHAYVFTDWRQYTNLNYAWETKGWALRACVVWDKARGGAMGSFWRNNHEWIPVYSKGPPRSLPNGGFFNVWSGTKPQGDVHPTVKPLGLLKRLVEATASGVVLDPFMGSGTTLRAAKDLGRKAIGIEIEERYCEIAAKRLDQEVLF